MTSRRRAGAPGGDGVLLLGNLRGVHMGFCGGNAGEHLVGGQGALAVLCWLVRPTKTIEQL